MTYIHVSPIVACPFPWFLKLWLSLLHNIPYFSTITIVMRNLEFVSLLIKMIENEIELNCIVNIHAHTCTYIACLFLTANIVARHFSIH